tara:strand:+ start:27 stop:242 length:216 start_codon:yes stop_codon:yes gene_type:complete
MDKINMINYQQLVLQTKFGKRNEKKTSKIYVITALILICIFFSLFFSNTESQVLNSSSFFPGSFLLENFYG